ncbi:hypothetical protein GGF42_005680 [Coemansia sp. RSA 2424]|nr:hypothetical protein GGF42_005680 [Coemansia sp. RSA 2424]
MSDSTQDNEEFDASELESTAAAAAAVVAAGRVPDSKGGIFASESLSLIEKCKLVKLMESIADD